MWWVIVWVISFLILMCFIGAGILLYSGALTASLIVSSGITPAFAIGELDVTED